MRRTLILWNTVALLVLFAIMGATARGIVRTGMLASVDRELALRTERFIKRPPRVDPEERPAGRRGQGNPYKPHRFDLSGLSVIPAGHYPLWDESAFAQLRTRQVEGPLTTTIERDEEPLRVLSMPVFENGTLVGIVQTPYPVTEVERASRLLDGALLPLLPLVLLAAWAGAAVLTQRVLQPVHALTKAGAELGAQDLSQRLPVVGSDEFANLALTFNGMLARIEGVFERQRRFTSDASHELKTPLTLIKGTVGMTLIGPESLERYRDALLAVEKATDRMSQLVHDLLFLSRADVGDLGHDLKPLFVAELIEQACACLPPLNRPVPIVAVDPTLRVSGNEAELVRLYVNLLSNACRYTPPEGKVTVGAERSTDGVVVTVTDTGIGIAPEHLPHLGERFYRVDTARARQQGGTGLGLAICKGIVEGHGGTIEFESAPLKGTTVRVQFPA